MINEIYVEGRNETTLCTIAVTTQDLALNFSAGDYIVANVTKYTTKTNASLTVPTPSVDTDYQIWLATDGLHVLTRATDQDFGDLPQNYLDLLVWFTMPAGAVDLNNVTINVKVIH